MLELFWLLLPVAAGSGWLAGVKNNKTQLNTKAKNKDIAFNQKYIKSLNLILNEQTDKAVDVLIDLFSVDNDTVETHLALGSLFRRRGEVERAIRIHQNVIARPNLAPQQRLNGLLELGCDYLYAGVLDRAENVFIDILKQDTQNIQSLQYLLDIYQQQQDWQSAINIALLLQKQTFNKCTQHAKYAKNIANYYCELTVVAKERGNLTEAFFYNRQALKYQENNLRANLIFADLCILNKQIKKGLNIYINIADSHRNYLDIIMPLLIKAYLQHESKVNNLIIFVEKQVKQVPQVLCINEVIALFTEHKGYNYILEMVADSAVKSPKLRSIFNLLQLIGEEGFVDSRNYIRIRDCIGNIIDEQKLYQCNNCGFNCRELLWLCPSCKSWDTISNIEFVD